MKLTSVFAALVVALGLMVPARAIAQNPSGNGSATAVQATTPYFSLTPISATAAVNTAVTLTIPAPAAGLYNYVCGLSFELNSDATGAAASNVVSTSTNFNAFAVKVSMPATVSIDGGVQAALPPASPATGCYKSAAPGTATTFVSPAGLTHIAWSWYAGYYQAPYGTRRPSHRPF